MRILYVGNINNSHEQQFVLPIATLGQEVHIISSELPKKKYDKVTVHLYQPDEKYKGSNSLVRFLRKIIDMQNFIDQIKPDILHFHFIVDLAFTAPFLRFKHVFLTPWGSDILIFPRRSKLQYLLVKLTLMKAKAITPFSQQMLDRIKEMVDVKDKGIIKVVFGVDKNFTEYISAKRVKELRQKLQISTDEKIVLSFRNLMEVYNLEEIIQAMSLAVKRDNKIKLIILYEYNIIERVNYIKNMVKEYGLDKNTVYVNGVSHNDMFNYYKLADIGISFSKSDGCPVSVQECMAAKLPLVVSDIPANREILREKSASFVKLGDISNLAQKINLLLNDRDLKKRQIENAYEDILKIGFKEDIMERMNNFYNKYCQEHIKK